MKLTRGILTILAVTTGLLQTQAIRSFADDPNTANPTAPAPTPGASQKPEAAQTEDEYQKSKYTRDEQEGKADKRKLLLTTGEDKPVDIDFEVASANAVSVGNPKVVATTLVKIGEKRQLVFKPLSTGETNVTLRDQNGDIKLIFAVRVTGSNLLTVASEIRDLLRDIEGLDIRIVGSKVIVDGELITPNDYGRLITVVNDKAYADFVINLAQLSNKAMAAIAKRVQQDVNSFAPNVTTRVVNGVVFLEGTVDNIDQARRAKDVAQIYLPDVRPNTLLENTRDIHVMSGRTLVQNFIIVNPPPPRKQEKLVRVTVHFVELSKDYNNLFGFVWQPGFTSAPQINVGAGSTGGAAAQGSSFTATLSNLFPNLASAQTAGYARILKTGTVVVRSGQNAVLSEQTQFPYSVSGANGQVNAATTGVGIDLGVTPQILGQSEDISMDIKLNQTELVGRAPASGSGVRPTTSTHKVETKIYVKSNESAAVAGVNSSVIGTDFNKDNPNPGSFGPGTAPLFTLLHSKNYQKQKSQFVIFVTPQIVENASEGTEDLKKNFRIKVK
jgi:pilus assembly protein CpaC